MIIRDLNEDLGRMIVEDKWICLREPNFHLSSQSLLILSFPTNKLYKIMYQNQKSPLILLDFSQRNFFIHNHVFGDSKMIKEISQSSEYGNGWRNAFI